MTFLVDSNIWLEKLLGQQKMAEVNAFLAGVPAVDLILTDFALYSIGLRICRAGCPETYEAFLRDVVIPGDTRVVRLSSADLTQVARIGSEGPLDFDDAYQYVAAEKYDLQIVSFDADFDKTARGRIRPAEALKRYRQQQAQGPQPSS